MPAKLSVNVNAIAFLRNRRDLPWPSVTALGRIALEAGAAGLTVHPRPDERHIRRADLAPLRAVVDAFEGAEFNIEGYPTAEFVDLCLANRPDQITLVPDHPSQATSDHGWDAVAHRGLLQRAIAHLKRGGGRISVFCDPDADDGQLEAMREVGADRVELYTGPYGGTFADPAAAQTALADLAATAARAHRIGLGVNAGHDLTVDNLPALVRAVPMLAEVSIGHALTADALMHGMAGAVARFVQALEGRSGDAAPLDGGPALATTDAA